MGYRVSLWAERMFGREVLVAQNCCCSTAQSCLTLCSPMDCSTLGLPVFHYLQDFGQTNVHCVGDALQPFPPLLPSLALIFPSIQVFSNESALSIRWPKYCSFGFSVSPFNEYSGLLAFRMDWFNLLAVQGTLKRCTKFTLKWFDGVGLVVGLFFFFASL